MSSKNQTTELYLMGSKHEQNDEIFNYGMLVKVLEKISPELILEEKPLDWEMYDENYSYKAELFTDPDYSMRNESKAIWEYKQKNQVQLRPLDMPGYGVWCRKHQYPAKVDALCEAVNWISENIDKLAEFCHIINPWLELAETEALFDSLEGVNSPAYHHLSKRMEAIFSEQFPQVFASCPNLAVHLETLKLRDEEWTTRNDCMVESTIKWLAELQPERAVIITGATHIYYLLDKLQPLQAANNFKIIDIRKTLVNL